MTFHIPSWATLEYLQYIAIRKESKGKIHFTMQAETSEHFLTSCSIRILSEGVTIDTLDDINTFKAVMNDNNLCMRCKKEMEGLLSGKQEVFYLEKHDAKELLS